MSWWFGRVRVVMDDGETRGFNTDQGDGRDSRDS